MLLKRTDRKEALIMKLEGVHKLKLSIFGVGGADSFSPIILN